MSTLTAVNGWSVPALTDSPNIVTAVKTAVDAIDLRSNPIFSTTTARDAAITAPTEGMECYVTGTKEKYIYSGTGWIGLAPRFYRVTSDQTVTDSIGLTNATQYAAPVEANSVYAIDGLILNTNVDASNSNDFAAAWTIPASASGVWQPTQGGTGNTVTSSAGVIVVGFAWATPLAWGVLSGSTVATPWSGTLVTSSTAGTLQFQFAEAAAVGGVTSVTLKSGSWLRIWKVG